ncbi:Helix-turn-helix domain-containing protein [Cruoricaptor ignavus]|uniref:Helix-turn-helix domain-containing protein n=2 Tax=Cruoricaptor ignavus TaxID=1118202 RepID=A0A1M6HBN6_9FLAO|nr:Helix-turn-helix domain-containing protein [Cruoricaptor ignavus]
MAVTEEVLKKRTKLAETVRKIREEKGLTQQEVANATEMSWSTIQRFEMGKFSLNWDLLVRIFDVLEIEVKLNDDII